MKEEEVVDDERGDAADEVEMMEVEKEKIQRWDEADEVKMERGLCVCCAVEFHVLCS